MIEISKKNPACWHGLCAVPFLIVVFLFEILPLAGRGRQQRLFKEDALSFGNYVEILRSQFLSQCVQGKLRDFARHRRDRLVVALPIGVILRRMPGRIQQFVLVCSNIGANFTGFPLAFAFVIMMGVSGSFTLLLAASGIASDFTIYSTTGLVIVYSYFQILFAILLLLPGLAAITAEIEEAAYLMGASRLVFWRRIGLPILAPNLVSAFLLLFANAMGTYATAWALVGGSANLVTIRIGELTAGDVFSDPNLADALAMLLVISLVVPIVIEQVFLKPRQPDA